MIVLKNIFKRFKNNDLFNDVSYTFNNGKKYLIIGDNGIGKSVLLKMIVGYAKPNSGEIFIDDKKMGIEFDFLPESGVSIDAPQFIDSMSGIDNLLEIARITKICDKDRIYDLAVKLKLDSDLNKKYHTYSLGMRQKMRFIQAIMDNPKYLILDEPFDGLDKDSKSTIKDIINEYINEDNERIVIFTSHDTQLFDFADIILRIENKDIFNIN